MMEKVSALILNKLKRHLKLYPMILLAIMAWSCVRVEEPRKSWQRTPMVITRDQRGVTLHLTTVKDQRYNILYQDPAPGGGKTDWKILPNAREIRGTGDVVEIFDDDPRARRRNYRQQTLLAMPASKVPPQLR